MTEKEDEEKETEKYIQTEEKRNEEKRRKYLVGVRKKRKEGNHSIKIK